MGARMRVIAAVVPAAVLLLAGGAEAGGSPAPAPAPAPAAALVEHPSCAAGAATSRTSAPGAPAGSTDVHLAVPRQVTVRLDQAGTVVAAATNTGCAPGAGDLFVVEGTALEAGPDVVAATIEALGSAGDWTDHGRFVPVP